MAMNMKKLSVLAYASGFTLWHYSNDEEQKQACTSNYFNAASEMLNVGDIIILSSCDGAALLSIAEKAKGAVQTVAMC